MHDPQGSAAHDENILLNQKPLVPSNGHSIDEIRQFIGRSTPKRNSNTWTVEGSHRKLYFDFDFSDFNQENIHSGRFVLV